MSPLQKTESGWRIDKGALIAYLIILILGSSFSFLGSYKFTEYKWEDFSGRITKLEILGSECARRITENEKYVAADKADTVWFKQTFQDIKIALTEIRQDQKRRVKNEK